MAELFRVDPASLHEDSSQDNIPNWDSLGMINLVTELEQVFKIRFDVLEVQDLKNIRLIKTILTEKGIIFES